MTRHEHYFDQPEGAASVLKHGLLRYYLPAFVGKTGQRSRDRRVVFVDGYAGAGRHVGGSKGSPLLVAEIAENLGPRRSLCCVFVEKHPAIAAQLRVHLAAEAPGLAAPVLDGDVAEHIDAILLSGEGSPMFVFLDPFGVPVAQEHVVRILNRYGKGARRPATEVLLNFSAAGVWRIGGRLAAGIDDEPSFSKLDDACGGTWWREVFLEAVRQETPARARRVAEAYRDRTAQLTGSYAWLVPVRRRPTQEPIYYLLHFSRHADGQWEFGMALSYAQALWRQAWPLQDRAARDARELASGQEAMFEVGEVAPDPDFEKRLDVLGQDVGDARRACLIKTKTSGAVSGV